MAVPLTPAAASLWAKSDRGLEPGAWHPLIAHLLDVAACADAMLDREPPATLAQHADSLALPADVARSWIVALVALHDLGKANTGFQSKWYEGRQRVETHLPWTGAQDRETATHGVVSQAALETLLHDVGWERSLARAAAHAVAAHHGFRPTAEERTAALRRLMGEDDAWSRVRAELFQAVLDVLEVPKATVPKAFGGGAFMRLAGLTSFADWLGSDHSKFPFGRDTGDLKAYYARARALAERALDEIGWYPKPPLSTEPVAFEQAFGFSPRGVQSAVAEFVRRVDGPGLLLLEVPTGEGKTEAGLLAFLELQRQLDHRGLYVALPTQATGNAMFDRVQQFLRGRGLTTPVDLQLVHGATLLNDSYQALRLRGVADPDGGGEVTAATWFSNRKRALLSGFGVGTVDQALLGVLHVKHQFVRLWGLTNRVVLIDEVHAYDTYTSGLIDELLRWLAHLGSSVIVMSATLPSRRRRELLAAFGATAPMDGSRYPRVAWAPLAGTAEEVSVPSWRRAEIHVEAAPNDLPELARWLVSQVRDGGLACSVMNTVRRAQELYLLTAALAAPLGIDVKLFHSRFSARRRAELEAEVRQGYGKTAQRTRPSILIATQVVEQSLDLDFDVMVTDLAPIDLVLQRAGRLHRHERQDRPSALRIARLAVVGLGEEPLPDLASSSRVYDAYILLRSWWALRRRVATNRVTVPDDVEALIEFVYGDAPVIGATREQQEAFEATREASARHRATDASKAAEVVLVPPDELLNSAPPVIRKSDDEDADLADLYRARTRLGTPGVRIVPLHRNLHGLTLMPDHGAPIDLAEVQSLERAKEVYLGSLEIPAWLAAPLTEQSVPEAWQDSALLRGLHVLEFEGGEARLGRHMARIDDEIGFSYDLERGEA